MSKVFLTKNFLTTLKGRAMAQALSHLAFIAKALVLFPAAPRVVCGGQSGTWADFSTSTFVFPSQFYSTNTAYCQIYLNPNRLRVIGFSVIAVEGGIRIRMYLSFI